MNCRVFNRDLDNRFFRFGDDKTIKVFIENDIIANETSSNGCWFTLLKEYDCHCYPRLTHHHRRRSDLFFLFLLNEQTHFFYVKDDTYALVFVQDSKVVHTHTEHGNCVT